VDQAAEIVSRALRMSEIDATRLVELWDDPAQDQVQYLQNCAKVWDALEESSRLLPLGWYERVFRDVQWMPGAPRALHAVADAVSVTLVKDLVPENVAEALLSPWRAFCVAVVA
jgi:hypothetical protein